MHPSAITVDVRNSLETNPRTCVLSDQQPRRNDIAAPRNAPEQTAASETIVISAKSVILEQNSEWRRARLPLAKQGVVSRDTIYAKE